MHLRYYLSKFPVNPEGTSHVEVHLDRTYNPKNSGEEDFERAEKKMARMVSKVVDLPATKQWHCFESDIHGGWDPKDGFWFDFSRQAEQGRTVYLTSIMYIPKTSVMYIPEDPITVESDYRLKYYLDKLDRMLKQLLKDAPSPVLRELIVDVDNYGQWSVLLLYLSLREIHKLLILTWKTIGDWAEIIDVLPDYRTATRYALGALIELANGGTQVTFKLPATEQQQLSGGKAEGAGVQNKSTKKRGKNMLNNAVGELLKIEPDLTAPEVAEKLNAAHAGTHERTSAAAVYGTQSWRKTRRPRKKK